MTFGTTCPSPSISIDAHGAAVDHTFTPVYTQGTPTPAGYSFLLKDQTGAALGGSVQAMITEPTPHFTFQSTDCTDAGTHPVRFKVTDGSSATAICDFDLVVSNQNGAL